MNRARNRTEPSAPAVAPDRDADDDPRMALSALADGDAASLAHACDFWRRDEQARRDWHAWHLIGDVMRSDELATGGRHDSDFLAGFRARLDAEPVVLAPTPQPRRVWLVPAAAAAGFAAVAVTLVALRGVAPQVQPPAAQMASAGGAGPVAASLQLVGDRVVGAAAVPHMMVRDQGVIRDARLDEFLRAHQQARGGVAVVAPAGLQPAGPSFAVQPR